MLICPACEKEVEKLCKHHWFEFPDGERYEKEICNNCNNLLMPSKFYPKKECFDHVLPCWDEQLKYLRSNKSHILDSLIFYRTYDIEPFPYDSDKEGEYYRVLLGFDNLEDAKKCLDKWLDAGDIKEGYWNWGDTEIE